MLAGQLLLGAWVGFAAHSGAGQQPTYIRAVQDILRQQATDGAITMAFVGPNESNVNPYFGCFAAEGLLSAYETTHTGLYLDAALRWVAWYAAHQNPDGTIYDYKGRSANWKSTNNYDSSDSYAAVYLALLDHVYRVVRDKAWVVANRRSIDLALAGIRLTMQPCGMTLAKPTWPVMYAMDNTETLRGLRAAENLAGVLGDPSVFAKVRGEANRMEAAITGMMWDPMRFSYRIGVQPDGGKMEGLKEWYPDIMANLMAVAWLPTSARNRTLFDRLYKEFEREIPAQIDTVDDLEKLIWWSYAAKDAGNSEVFERTRARLDGFDKVCVNGCDAGDLGHVARLTANR